MRKTTYACDHCQRELKESQLVAGIKVNSPYPPFGNPTAEFDLCRDCVPILGLFLGCDDTKDPKWPTI